MLPKKEIEALFLLLDDPDAEVYDTVANKIIDYGKEIIPSLEFLWETTEDEAVQERITNLIHRVHFQDLQAEFRVWLQSDRPEVLRGAILVAKYHYPEMNIPFLLTQFDQIRRNLWLELNNYLTAIEKVNIFNGILYNYYKLKGHEIMALKPEHYFINKALESKHGNVFSFGVLYVALAELLDIPIFAVDIPRQFLLAYVDILQHFYTTDDATVKQISFFIDPMNGMIYTHNDIEFYLNKLGYKGDRAPYFEPQSSVQIIIKMLEELSNCYERTEEQEKADELQVLLSLLKKKSDA